MTSPLGKQKKYCRLNSLEHTCYKFGYDAKLVLNRVYTYGFCFNEALTERKKKKHEGKLFIRGRSAREIAIERNIPPSTFYNRIKRGWSLYKALGM